jgi:DNA ligase 1
MRAFADLYQTLDRTTSSRLKVAAMVEYFGRIKEDDAAWAVYFLAGGKIKRLLPIAHLRAYAQRQTGLPVWLFEECYQTVGDLAETIALLLPPPQTERDTDLNQWVTEGLLPLQSLSDEQRSSSLDELLDGWDTNTRFICLKLITGGFRVGVSRLLVTRALAQLTDLPTTQMAQRMMGYFSGRDHPTGDRYRALIANGDTDYQAIEPGQPYPFFLAQPLARDDSQLQDILSATKSWQMEWKWDGIRAQLVCRHGDIWLWSRGEELVSEQFPELCEAAKSLADGTVLDGEILVWHIDQNVPASFADLQKRLGRKRLSDAIKRDYPVVFMVYDLLEDKGTDCRSQTLTERRLALEMLISSHGVPTVFKLSPVVDVQDGEQALAHHAQAREQRAEGLMIKAQSSQYGVGRTRQAGLWFKWKLDPMSIDAVLIYAQRGHGRRASLYTDYTFAVWDDSASPGEPSLVPVAKADSGLTDKEIKQIDAILRQSTVESFGPVRRVEPTLVFEIGFEGILPSSRHKSGVALRFPRMLRWRIDKPVEQADTLATLKALL